MSFGKRLKQLREERELRQEDIAKLLNLSQSAIAFYESDTKQANNQTLLILADYFDVSLDYLLGRTDERKPSAPAKPELSKKDKQEIDNYIKDLESNVAGLMFDGQPISDEDKQLLLEQIERTAELIKLRNKEKYTPKKYRKK